MEKKFGYDPCVMSYWKKPVSETNFSSFSILHLALLNLISRRKRMIGYFGCDSFVTHHGYIYGPVYKIQ